jgi:hypothetical protein
MLTTTMFKTGATITPDGGIPERVAEELYAQYRMVLDESRLSWTGHLHLEKLLGAGGQGVVYLSRRRGADGFTLPVAVKIFSPERYTDTRSYDAAMCRIAKVGDGVG